MSWMARHVVKDHVGAYDVGNPVSEWTVSIDGAHRKPLIRQVKESTNIKRARRGVQLKVNNRKITGILPGMFSTPRMSFSAPPMRRILCIKILA